MKYEVRKTERKGCGIYACQPIGVSDVIAKVVFVREVTSQHPLGADEHYDHQIYLPDGRVYLVAEPMCYFNHACQPNAYLYSADQQYYVISKQPIDVDEEITIDYELSAIDGDVWECKCGAEHCRGLHKWDFFSLPRRTILESLPYLDPWFAQIHGERIRQILDQ